MEKTITQDTPGGMQELHSLWQDMRRKIEKEHCPFLARFEGSPSGVMFSLMIDPADTKRVAEVVPHPKKRLPTFD